LLEKPIFSRITRRTSLGDARGPDEPIIMAVRIQLDEPHAHFTNLDFITGKAILSLGLDTPISFIVVKLEGESRSRLAAPKYPHNERSDKKRTEMEVHKVREFTS
jgi:hypothetical protein